MLKFVDCNCAVGVLNAVSGWRVYDHREIERLSRACGIVQAFAYHNAALDLHPIDGNTEITHIAKQTPFFQPVWVVMPNDTGEFYDSEILISKLSESNVRMVRLFPKYNVLSYSLSDWCCGELLSALENAGISILLDADQCSWEEVHALCASHPNLKIILTNIYYRNARYLFPLLQKHRSLYAETSGMKSFGLLQMVCERVGSHKMVFGSNLGVFSVGSAICMITYANISQLDKEKIAGRNLMEIIELEVTA